MNCCAFVLAEFRYYPQWSLSRWAIAGQPISRVARHCPLALYTGFFRVCFSCEALFETLRYGKEGEAAYISTVPRYCSPERYWKRDGQRGKGDRLNCDARTLLFFVDLESDFERVGDKFGFACLVQVGGSL